MEKQSYVEFKESAKKKGIITLKKKKEIIFYYDGKLDKVIIYDTSNEKTTKRSIEKTKWGYFVYLERKYAYSGDNEEIEISSC